MCTLHPVRSVRDSLCLCVYVCVMVSSMTEAASASLCLCSGGGCGRDKSCACTTHELANRGERCIRRPAARKLDHKTHCEWANIAARHCWTFDRHFYGCSRTDFSPAARQWHNRSTINYHLCSHFAQSLSFLPLACFSHLCSCFSQSVCIALKGTLYKMQIRATEKVKSMIW